MKPWQITLEDRLAAADAPAVLSRDLLARFARAGRESPLPSSSLTYWLKNAKARGKLQPVQRGLFLNRFRVPPGQLADTAAWLQNDAILSLNTVLGDSGVLNNPSHVITAVVPVDPRVPPPSLGRHRTQAGTLHFFGIPRRVVEAGADSDRLASDRPHEQPRATPEKALLDWLYLAASPRSHRTWPPHQDIDMDLLDSKRLRKLAVAAGMKEVLETWLKTTSRQPVQLS